MKRIIAATLLTLATTAVPVQPAAAQSGLDKKVLEVKAGPGKEGRIIVEKHRESGGLIVPEGEHTLGDGPALGWKKAGAQPRLVGFDLMRQFFVRREVADESKDQRDVDGRGGSEVDHAIDSFPVDLAGKVEMRRPSRPVGPDRPVLRLIFADHPDPAFGRPIDRTRQDARFRSGTTLDISARLRYQENRRCAYDKP